MKRLARCLGAALLLTTLPGCPSLHAVSSPPPQARGDFDGWNDVVDLTAGTSLAIECRGTWTFEPCRDLIVTSDDTAIATIHYAHIGKYRSAGGFVADERLERSGFVISGIRAGRTTLRLGSGDGSRTLTVEVHP